MTRQSDSGGGAASVPCSASAFTPNEIELLLSCISFTEGESMLDQDGRMTVQKIRKKLAQPNTRHAARPRPTEA